MSLAQDPTANHSGLARRDHGATAKSAAALVFPRSGTQRRDVLARIYLAREEGRTRDELADELGLSPNTVRPRVKELLDAGWIEPSGATRKTPMGRDAEVLVLTLRARGAIAERRR